MVQISDWRVCYAEMGKSPSNSDPQKWDSACDQDYKFSSRWYKWAIVLQTSNWLSFSRYDSDHPDDCTLVLGIAKHLGKEGISTCSWLQNKLIITSVQLCQSSYLTLPIKSQVKMLSTQCPISLRILMCECLLQMSMVWYVGPGVKYLLTWDETCRQ